MTVQVTTIKGFTDPVVKRAESFATNEFGELMLYAGTSKTLSNLIAIYAPGSWLAVTKLADPETPDAQDGA